MNRPPRKKTNKDALLKDPRFDEEELEKAGSADSKKKSDATGGDDRNLVEVDEAFKEAEFEDKVWLVWNQNKGAIVGGALAALLAVVGVQSYRWYQEDKVVKMQAVYAEADDSQAKLAFAEDYSGEALGGIALLTVADEKYEAGEFSEAAVLYSQAAEALEESPVKGRALLGNAFSTIKAGDKEVGRASLNAVVDMDGLLESYRAQAIYHLCVLAVQDENFDEAKILISKMETLDYGGSWESQVLQLKRSTPALADEEEE